MSADRTRQLNHELEPDLSRLPPLEPPRDVLPQILAEVGRRTGRGRRRPKWLQWAAAAVLLLSLGVIAMLAQRVDGQSRELAEWVRYSQDLEAQLRLVGSRNRVVRGHRAAALVELEDQIALIDWQLAGRPPAGDEIDLWRQRALLLHDLVTVRADDRVPAGERSRRPVVTLNRPLGVVPASYEL